MLYPGLIGIENGDIPPNNQSFDLSILWIPLFTSWKRNPEYKCFCVDGGMVVLEDYLTVRPDHQERLKKLVEAKKIQLVSWYTLPEMFTVAPEALIRNLLIGSKMAIEFGGAIKTGYTATFMRTGFATASRYIRVWD